MPVPNAVVRVVVAVCLFAAVPALGVGLFGGPPEPGKAPTRFVRLEAVAGGPLWATGGIASRQESNIRVGAATCVMGRFRVGLTVSDAYNLNSNYGGVMPLPFHVGYTLWSSPRPEWMFWGSVPDLYVEVSAPLLGNMLFGSGNMARASLCLDADYYGLGVRLESGVLANWVYAPNPETQLYVTLHLRLLTFGIGF